MCNVPPWRDQPKHLVYIFINNPHMVHVASPPPASLWTTTGTRCSICRLWSTIMIDRDRNTDPNLVAQQTITIKHVTKTTDALPHVIQSAYPTIPLARFFIVALFCSSIFIVRCSAPTFQLYSRLCCCHHEQHARRGERRTVRMVQYRQTVQ